MGGNALASGSMRMNREVYNAACEALELNHEGSLGEHFHVRVIPSYESKSDFGDIDLICLPIFPGYPSADDLEELLRNGYCATEFVHNGNVLSFDLRQIFLNEEFVDIPLPGPGIQVDLIRFNDRKVFEFAYNYFSYNDLGNLLGRIAHSMGFKLGHDGLTYKYLRGTYLVEEITLTQDYYSAIEFLGYDPERFKEGFQDLKDIFEYVSSSPYFRSDIFLLENRDGESRRRDFKRKTYSSFLAWCEENQSALGEYEFPIDKNVWLNKAFESFQGFEEKFIEATRKAFVQTVMKEAFSGGLVKTVTGLEGPKLGSYISYIKKSFGSQALFERELLFNTTGVTNRIPSLLAEFNSTYSD